MWAAAFVVIHPSAAGGTASERQPSDIQAVEEAAQKVWLCEKAHSGTAHALALDRTLVTNNPRDFADVQGLEIENWTR